MNNDELEIILTDSEMFERFKDFDNNMAFFSMSKEEYILKMTDMIYSYYINKNAHKSYIFHKLVISVLGPMIKADYSLIFKNKLLALLAKKYTTYNAFIKGFIGLEKEELSFIIKNDIADMLENDQFDINYFFNFIDSTVNDRTTFLRTKDAHDLSLDYVVYYNLAKTIISNYKEYLPLAVKIIGMEKVRELEIAAKIEVVPIQSKKGTTNGTHSFSKHKHRIEVSSDLIKKYQETLDKKDLAKIIAVTYHEAQHSMQYELYYNSDLKNYKILLWAKEELARLALSDQYYNANYKSFIYESDANYVGWKNSLKFFNDELDDFSLDEFFNDNMRLYKTRRKNPFHKDTENLVGHGIIEHEAASLLNVITATSIKKNPNILKKFSILGIEYNIDGTIKSTVDKLREKKRYLYLLDLDLKEAYSNYFSDLISREDIIAKEIELHGYRFDLNRLYDFVLNRFVDNHIDALCDEIDPLLLVDDAEDVLISLIDCIFANFYNEDMTFKISRITSQLNQISTYLLAKRNKLDKWHFLKKISYKEWSDISTSLSEKYHYINYKLNFLNKINDNLEPVFVR